jgi:spermidine/putrescine transport system substrate-binding protein
LAKEIKLYDWAGDEVQPVLDAFEAEYGVTVTYVPYDTQEEALANIKAGQVYDLLVLDNQNVFIAIQQGLMVEIDYAHVPNFKNTLANFRDLSFDPGNKHSVPFTWGVTALLVHDDLKNSVTRWTDLWQLPPDSKIALRDESREVPGMVLKSLGYSLNSENPEEIKAAFERLKELQGRVVFVESSAEEALPRLAAGEAAVLAGWAEDGRYATAEGMPFTYIYPEEGAMLWGDSFVIPATSPNQYTAELFLNFLLRPEINAQIVNETYYATTNQAAREFVNKAIQQDTTIFPPPEVLQKAEVMLPLSAEATQLYDDAWAEFKNSLGPEATIPE